MNVRLSSALDVAESTVAGNGVHDYRITNYHGAMGHRRGGPQCFLVEALVGDAIVPPHFHEVDQYQIFVAGAARMGTQTATPIHLHYADGYTPYGPIKGIADPFAYLTVRAVADPGGPRWMPQSRSERGRHLGGRHLSTPVRVPSQPGYAFVEGMPPHADGLAVYVARVARNAPVPPLPACRGIGRYVMVMDGTLCTGQREHPAYSSVYLAVGDVFPDATAGSDGLVALVLDFAVPRDAGARR